MHEERTSLINNCCSHEHQFTLIDFRHNSCNFFFPGNQNCIFNLVYLWHLGRAYLRTSDVFVINCPCSSIICLHTYFWKPKWWMLFALSGINNYINNQIFLVLDFQLGLIVFTPKPKQNILWSFHVVKWIQIEQNIVYVFVSDCVCVSESNICRTNSKID